MTRSVPGRVAVLAAACFVAALFALHLLRPDVSPLARVTSEFAVGRYGTLMTGAYVALAVAFVALAAGLARAENAPPRSSPGIVLLALAALGVGTAALFPVDVGAVRPVTTAGRIHRAAAIVAFVSMSAAPLVLARAFRSHPAWRSLAWLGVAVGVVGLAGLAAIQLVLLERGYAGAAQRIVLALVVAWTVAAALRLEPQRRESDSVGG